MSPMKELPKQARVVVVGGGVAGCSTAYHLGKLGVKDTVLLERKQLTCGTTWHAAGLMTTVCFPSETITTLARYSRDLYAGLEEETGQHTGFNPVGYIQLANTKARLEELRRTAAFVRHLGASVEEISAAEVRRLWPLAETGDVIAGFYAPEDGRTNPIDTTMALARGARMNGVSIFEETAVTGFRIDKGRVRGVITDRGEIEAETVVICGGMWARQLGRLAGVNVPLHAAEHYYLCTEAVEGASRDLPILEDLERFAYFREETGGFMLGLFEPVAAPWGMNGIPDHFTFGELNPDWDRMLPYIEEAMKRIPVIREAGIRMLFCGPESFTPDMNVLFGPAPEVDGLFVAAGFNSLGIILGGGAGMALAHWIVDGLPPIDVCEICLDRMHPFQNSPKFLHDRTVELLGLMYVDHWPNRRFETAAGARRSPIHDRLKADGAWFCESKGWEFADWFAPDGNPPAPEYSWGRQNWFEWHKEEHLAARRDAVLFDLTLMGKFLVQGPDAEKVLGRLSANDVNVPPGRIVYTQWLNQNGGIETDLTVTRLAEDRFLVVASDVIHTRVPAMIRRATGGDNRVSVTDVTSGFALISLQGPKSRDVLQGVTSADLSPEAFAYRDAREIDLGYGLGLAVRISYVGELGWELYIPSEFAVSVYDALKEAGKAHGLRPAGIQTLGSLRLEKAYRDYGHDIDNMDTPYEAGLGFAVRLDKPGGFTGREALAAQKESGPPRRRLVQFLVEDPEPLLFHGEPIHRNGQSIGYIRAGAYGHSLGGAVGLGSVECDEGVTAEYVKAGRYEIEIAGKKYPARASLRPMFDPDGERLKG